MGEYALYCGLGDRVAVLTYTKQEGKKHLLLEKDLAAYGTKRQEQKTRRRRITPEGRKAAAPGLKAELVAEGAIVLKRRRRNDLMTQNAGAAFGSARAVFLFGILTAEYAVEQIDAEHDDEDHNENGTPANAHQAQGIPAMWQDGPGSTVPQRR